MRSAYARGEGVDQDQLLSTSHFAASQWRDAVKSLQGLKLIKLDKNQRWRLGRDLKAVTLWQLVQVFPENVLEEVLITVSDFPELVQPLLALVEYGESHLSLNLDEIFTGLEAVY